LTQEICLTKKANIAENVLKHAQIFCLDYDAVCLSAIMLAILANIAEE